MEENSINSTLKKESIDIPGKPENSGTSSHPKSKFMSKKPTMFFLGFIFTAFIFSFIAGGLYLGKNQMNKDVACTEEAKICPDGVTSVGRSGPKCEFAPCPNPTKNASTNISYWKTFTNSKRGYSFKYDPKFTVESVDEAQVHFEHVEVTIAPVEYVAGSGDGETLSKGSHALFTIYKQKDISRTELLSEYGDDIEINDYKIDDKKFISIKLPGEKLANIYYYEIGPEVLEISAWVGFNNTDEEKNEYIKEFEKILSTFKFTDSNFPTAFTQNFLEIPEYGVKIPLTDSNKDAYYVMKTSNDVTIAQLKVHSLDLEPYCNDNSTSGLASITKVSKDNVNERQKAIVDSGNASLIGNYYYYLEGSQAVCSQIKSNQTIETNARKAFNEASKNITSL